jgi:hypothetical protein
MRALWVLALTGLFAVIGSAAGKSDSIFGQLTQSLKVPLASDSTADGIKWISGVPSKNQPPPVSLGNGQWIMFLRNTARVDASPVPAAIKEALAGWFDNGLLEDIRFKVGDESFFYSSSFIADTSAVTVVDVIVFKSAAAASTPALWAHQLVHAKQFREWGASTYLNRFFQNRDEVEAPAKAIERDYVQLQGPRVQPDNQAASADRPVASCIAPGTLCQLPTRLP